MKKYLFIALCTILVVFCSSSFSSERNDSKTNLKKAQLFGQVGVTAVGAFGGYRLADYLHKKNVLKNIPIGWKKIGLTFGLGALGYVSAYFGLVNRKAAVTGLSLVQQMLSGKVSNPKLLEEISSLNEGSLQSFVAELLSSFGKTKALKAVKMLEQETKRKGRKSKKHSNNILRNLKKMRRLIKKDNLGLKKKIC